MTRTVGQQPRDEFILDPVRAWHRGRVLDALLDLLKTKTDYRDKDRIDRAALQRLRDRL